MENSKDPIINTDSTEPASDTTSAVEPVGILSDEATARLRAISPPPTPEQLAAAALSAQRKAVTKRVAASRARKKALLRHLDKEAAAALEPETDDDRSRRLRAEEEAEADRLEQNFLDDIEFGLEDCGENPPDADLQSKIDKFLSEPEKNLKFDFLLVYLGSSAGKAILKSMDIESPFGPGYYADDTGVHPMVRGSMRECTDGSYKYAIDKAQEESTLPLKSTSTMASESAHYSPELHAFAHDKMLKIAEHRIAREAIAAAEWESRLESFRQKFLAARKKSKAAR